MDYFGIQFNSQKGIYSPGQEVTGDVVIRSAEPINARFLKICIHGTAKTEWKENEHHHRTNFNGEREGHDELVKYSSEINYVSGEVVAWSARGGLEKIPSGHHKFPFSFPLPIDCPPSYEGFHGSVRYSVRVELDRPWKFNKKEKEYFTVIPNFDLNYLPFGNSPVVKTDLKNIGVFFQKGNVLLKVEIPKQGFTPGEFVPISIQIDNTSKRPATCIRAELHQHSYYKASRNAGIFSSHSCSHEHSKEETKRIGEVRKAIKVPAKSEGGAELKIKIPKCAPSFQCPIITLEYCLSVKLDTETSMNNTLHCEFPLIIGTVPISDVSTALVPSAPFEMAVNPRVVSSIFDGSSSSSFMPPVFPISVVAQHSAPFEMAVNPRIVSSIFDESSSSSFMPPVFPRMVVNQTPQPSAPQFERTESMPPAYTGPSTPQSDAPPPSYEESMAITKV